MTEENFFFCLKLFSVPTRNHSNFSPAEELKRVEMLFESWSNMLMCVGGVGFRTSDSFRKDLIVEYHLTLSLLPNSAYSNLCFQYTDKVYQY